MGPAQQQRHLDAMGRHRGHHRPLDVAAAAARRPAPAAAILAPGDAELRSRKKRPAGSARAQASAAATVWLAVTAETTRSACPTAPACDSASVTPCTRRVRAHRAPAAACQLHVERRHVVARGAQILGRPDLAVPTPSPYPISATFISRCTAGPAAASGSRIPYMSRPSTPAASLARFSSSLASRLRGGGERGGGQRARHADDAVVVGDDHVARDAPARRRRRPGC